MSKFKCRFCSRTNCSTRIYTRDLQYDELSCPYHVKALESHADAVLGAPGKQRMHVSSTGRLERGKVCEEEWETMQPTKPNE